MPQNPLEEAYLVRDLVHDDNGRKLYDLMRTLCRVRMAILYDKIKDGQESRPVMDPDGNVRIGTQKIPMDLASYSALSGELRGLEWVFYHIDGLVRKADREDERQAREVKEDGR